MNDGLMWYEVNSFNENSAIEAFVRRLHCLPDVVYCKELVECKRVTVKLVDNLPKGHYLLKKENE